MKNKLIQKQRRHFFVMNMAAFALIFLTLGLLMSQVLTHFAYQETDTSLKQLSQNEDLLKRELLQMENPFEPARETEPPLLPAGSNRFNTQIILWSKDGQILNKQTLGGRFLELDELNFDNDQLDQIKELTLNAEETDPLYFHSIMIKKPASLDEADVAYVQFIANTNQIRQTMSTFQLGLVVSLIFFWLLSLAVSYYLSKKTMEPIIKSWARQQEFVENASHELRTPLAIIQNKLQSLFTHPESTILEESEGIAQALNETRRLTTLTKDLLTIARSDSNQVTLELAEVFVPEFLENLIQPFQEIAEMDQKQFVFTNTVAKKLEFDQKRIHQLFVILLDNALKYTKAGDQISLSSQITGHDWIIEIKNTGTSISKEAKQHIFDRFYREDQARNKETGGHGLGLAIAQQIVSEHRGQIKVFDNQPQGVIFQIKLPI